MAEFTEFTRIYESLFPGERGTKPILVNLAHVRQFYRNVDRGTTWIRWNAPDVPDTEIVQSYETVRERVL